MSTRTLTDVDVRVRDHVVRQLEWDPEVDASGVGVTADNGVVTLSGAIDTYAGKLAAERAAKRVRGVRGVANDLVVRLKVGRTDADIARDAVLALELRESIPESVQVVVHDGYVTLTGKVLWLHQARSAEKAVRHVRGVRGVFDHVEVAGTPTVSDVRQRIVDALHRDADLDAGGVTTSVSGTVAVLTGAVPTWRQRESAGRAAGSAPGITRVDNHIVVHPRARLDEIC